MAKNEIKSGRPKSGKSAFTEIFRDLVGKATQQEIADKIGVSRQNVGKWLSGTTTPDIIMLARISTAYNVSTDFLLGLTNAKTTDPNLKSICDFLGLSEESLRKISQNFSLREHPDDKFEGKYARNREVANFLFESYYFFQIVYALASLMEESEKSANENVFELEDLFKFAEILGIDPFRFAFFMIEKSGAKNSNLIRGKFALAKLRLFELVEEISKNFDISYRKRDYILNLTKEQFESELFGLLGITPEELQKLKGKPPNSTFTVEALDD